MTRHRRTERDDAALMARALQWTEFFSHWSQERRDDLLKSARLEHYRRRTPVLAQNRHRRELLVVVSGCLEISCVSGVGRKYLDTLLGPGQVSPLARLVEDAPVGYDYHAHEDSVIIHLPRSALIDALDADPILWREVARLAVKRQQSSTMALWAHTLGSIRRRVAATLMNLAEHHGLDQADGVDLRVRLSQHDLAAMLGLSRQTVSKELRALADARVIETRYKKVTVLDQSALRRIATED